MRQEHGPRGLSSDANRVTVKGKFLYAGDQKFYIKGTTYGTFAPQEDGSQFPDKDVVRKDFALMAEHGFNAVRTYTVPPKYLLDLAFEYNLKVMAGLPWEQHITFLDKASVKKDILKRTKESVLACKMHPAILCFTIGNEIPAPIVRWYGKKRVENFLKAMNRVVKEADPQSLVTYVNYPTTEYLDLGFLDFDCFNVYLETPEKLSAYMSRLHNLSGDRPLVLAEIGLDSMRNGEDKQAEVLKWQIQTIFGKGCAGMFIFAWTDEWWRGGFEIEDWDFGIVDRQRNPKLALFSVAETMHDLPFTMEEYPLISVVVCSYNGSATIRDTMEGLQKLTYPNFEVIVVNDGSRDHLAEIVGEYPVKLITTENRGLSNARNTGMYHSRGEIVAYIDDDAYPDPQWLHYLAYAYHTSDHAGMGGPNICPEEDGPIAQCVANAPGGPVHVLLSDEIAEHIPGCNMSFRRKALLEVGGFDPIYRAAGDDVDLCWRIQGAGYTIGFHPSAVVWHHRRNSVKTYWKQQKGYGKAEALLEGKWPEKYNGFGHLAWAGRIYGNGLTLPLQLKKEKIFHGSGGSALFQSVYQPAAGMINFLPLMPEWYLFIGLTAFVSALSIAWSVLLWALPVFLLSVAVVVIQALSSAYRNTSLPNGKKNDPKYILLITALHIMQPVARLYGRIKHGLTPWRKGKIEGKWKPALGIRPLRAQYWSESWHGSEEWLMGIEQCLIGWKTRVSKGGDFDAFDLQTRNGITSITRMLLTIEEHGANRQLVRIRAWARPTKSLIISFLIFSGLAVFAAMDAMWPVACILGLISLVFAIEYIIDTTITLHQFKLGLQRSGEQMNKPAKTVSAPLVAVIREATNEKETQRRDTGQPLGKVKEHDTSFEFSGSVR